MTLKVYGPWEGSEKDYFAGNKMVDIPIRKAQKALLLGLAGAWSRPGHGYAAVIPSGLECFGEIMTAC